MPDTTVNLSGLMLTNPIIPASGTFGFGYEFADLYDINVLGSLSMKGTTKAPRFGNPTPRIAEIPDGLINSVGLQNPGVEKVISEELPKLRQVYSKPVLANISGFSVDEFVDCAKKFDDAQGGGHSGNQHFLSQCPRGRHELRHGPESRRSRHGSCEKSREKARLCEADPQCDGHYRHCKGRGGGGSRRRVPHQHPSGDAD